MNTLQNPSEWAVQMGKIVISIIPTIRTFSYIFVPIRNSRFSSALHFFVLFRTFSCTNGRQSLNKSTREFPPSLGSGSESEEYEEGIQCYIGLLHAGCSPSFLVFPRKMGSHSCDIIFMVYSIAI